MRCTMGESTLSSMAIMHIKYDMPIDLDKVMVNLFEGLRPHVDDAIAKFALRNGIVLL